MVKLAEKQSCTGCAACQAACAYGAIQMKPDYEGFVYPQIDEERCVECGVCIQVCPALKETLPVQPPRQVFAAASQDEEIRKKSSSGSVFTALARHILKEGGTVYGAAQMPDNTVRHLRVQTEEELAPLRGSKYVQSDMKGCLASLCSDLRAGRRVLFAGTPCQVAGAFQLVHEQGLDDSRLVLCDIVCQGASSPQVWSDYISVIEKETGGPVSNVTFRGKEEGWHAASAVRFDDAHGMRHTDRRFNNLFFSGLVLRPACYSCRYTTPNRVADLTLADFWGIEATSNADMDHKGVSFILAHTQKGEVLLESCAELKRQEASLTDAVDHQEALRAPFPKPDNREQFWNEYLGRGLIAAMGTHIVSDPQQIYWQPQRIKAGAIAVLAPSDPGSKGDEALLRGLISALHLGDFVLLNPGRRLWSEAVPDCANCFREICMPLEKMPSLFTEQAKLIVLGADTVDGSCGLDSSLPRLETVERALQMGGEAYVFCSFRSTVASQVVERIKQLPEQAHFFLRDQMSVGNFERLTGRRGRFFPDFAFFCRKQETVLTKRIRKWAQEKRREGKMLVGLNFCEPSFTSFFAEHTMENRSTYVQSVLKLLLANFPTAQICLISHDARHWPGYFSDADYQQLAMRIAHQMDCEEQVAIIPPRVSHPELLALLPSFDFVLTARMHLSVAAIHAGIIPVVYTGAPEDKTQYSMIDKVRGMLAVRIERPELAATNERELLRALHFVSAQMESLGEEILRRETENEKKDACLLQDLKKFLKMPAEVDDENNDEKTVQRECFMLAAYNAFCREEERDCELAALTRRGEQEKRLLETRLNSEQQLKEEAQAWAKAEQTQKEEARAWAKAEQTQKEEAQAWAKAEQAQKEEARAWAKAEQTQKKEAQAWAKAEQAQKEEALAWAKAEQAQKEEAQAWAKTEQAQKEDARQELMLQHDEKREIMKKMEELKRERDACQMQLEALKRRWSYRLRAKTALLLGKGKKQ